MYHYVNGLNQEPGKYVEYTGLEDRFNVGFSSGVELELFKGVFLGVPMLTNKGTN